MNNRLLPRLYYLNLYNGDVNYTSPSFYGYIYYVSKKRCLYGACVYAGIRTTWLRLPIKDDFIKEFACNMIHNKVYAFFSEKPSNHKQAMINRIFEAFFVPHEGKV